MTPQGRVIRALEFKKPDRIPFYDSYWPEFEEAWRAAKGCPTSADIRDYYEIDLEYIYPDETPFPSQAGVLETGGEYEILRSGWGVVQRRRGEAKFYEELQVALPDKRKLDELVFEPPELESRYFPVADVNALKARFCLFAKTGGPYMRTSTLRGSEQWLLDLVEDPAFALELAMRMTRHMTAVGLETIRRYDLYAAGIWFFDDLGWNQGPMFSPRTFERVFYPCYKWMCDQYRAAGVRHILLHCDGNIEAILDMLVDAGIQGFHPVEPKAGMDVVKLRQRYGTSLALIGGLDNAIILPRGDKAEIAAHVRRVLEVGQDSGLVIGAHSIGPDVTVETYDFVRQLIREYNRDHFTG
jgi:uroporphyrinogen decarboxylase